jgi:hypothetical protein
VTYSRRAAKLLRREGTAAYCLPDLMSALDQGALDIELEAIRIPREYDTPTLRDVYGTDWPCEGRSEQWCVARTVRHFVALERVFDDVRPDVVVPEVGNETIRTAAHLIGMARGIPVLFLFYTIFPRPLRLYVNTMHAPIVSVEDLRELGTEERQEVEAFVREFTARDEPIRPYRHTPVSLGRVRLLARHLTVQMIWDRENDYLRPWHWLAGQLWERARAALVRPLYQPPRRPFVYFPLHVVDDYKVKRVLPDCSDQASIVEQAARALPHGYDLVVKEHPMSIGRNSVALLRRLRHIQNVRIVEPHTSSHELIRAAQGVVVISSTVGLEGLLYAKPVLTLGQPFYSGLGITLDVPSLREIRNELPALLDFRPDRERILRFLHAAMRACRPGAPALVDRSDANARAVAASLEDATTRDVQPAGISRT